MVIPSSPVTLKTIAAHVGVSHSTVSLALRKDPRISVATREKIQATAKKLGYSPDPAMSALISYRQRNRRHGDYGKLAILNAWGVAEDKLPQFFGTQLEGIRAQAATLGYCTELFPVPEETKGQQRLSRILETRGIRGLIVGPVPVESPQLFFDWERFCIIAIGHSLMAPQFHYVANNHHSSVVTAYQKLRAMGYKRIGFHNLANSEHRNRGMYRAAYLRCLAMDNIAIDTTPSLLVSIDQHADAAQWVASNRYDAVISGLSLVLLQQLSAAAIRVPDDVGVVAIGTSDSASAAMEEDLKVVGESAVILLHSMLLHGERGIPSRRKTLLIDPFWRDGPTIRPQATLSAAPPSP